MDILHHAAIGFAGSMSLASAGQPLASAAFLAASVLPDADIAFIAKGRRAYLKAHQSITHSLPLALGLGGVTAAVGAATFGPASGIAGGIAMFAGLAVHVLLDASNTLGTHLLWPWSRRIRLDAVFFIDAFSWMLTLATLATLWATQAAWPIIIYTLLMVAQIACRARLSRRARSESGYPISIPHPVFPWRYTLTRPERDGSTSLAWWSPFSGTTHEGQTLRPTPEAQAMTERSEAVADMRGFARALSIVDEDRSADRHQVILRDLSMRRLGGRYGEITLTRTSCGILWEHVNI